MVHPLLFTTMKGGSINYHGQQPPTHHPTPAIVPSCALRMYPLRRLKGRGAQKRVIPLAVLSVNSGVSSNSGLPHGVSRGWNVINVALGSGLCDYVWEKWWKMQRINMDKSSSAPSSLCPSSTTMYIKVITSIYWGYGHVQDGNGEFPCIKFPHPHHFWGTRKRHAAWPRGCPCFCPSGIPPEVWSSRSPAPNNWDD